MKPKEPQTPEEWQEAVNAAEFMLLVDSAEQYGLITGPKANIARCEEILERGQQLGHRPAPVEELIRKYVHP